MFMTSFNQSDPSRPSFFEVMAQDQLMHDLKPAVRYVVSVISLRNPSFEWVVKNIDEIFYTGMFFLESHFLSKYDATFSENFYTLKRVRTNSNEPIRASSEANRMLGTTITNAPKPMRRIDRFTTLFFLVVVPYLKGKADEYYKTANGRQHSLWNTNRPPEEASDNSYREKLKRLFILFYPYLNGVYEGLFFFYQLLYMHDYTRYYTPFLHLQGLELRRLSMEDMQQQARDLLKRRRVELRELVSLSANQRGVLAKIILIVKKFILRSRHFFEDYGQLLLPLSVFLFKFLEWWYSNENLISPPQKDPIPPPPAPPEIITTSAKASHYQKMEAVSLPQDRATCPLCNRKRVNPACVASSGIVYCYPCIHKYVSEHERCPVTLLPTSLDQIFHLYDEQ